MIQAQGVVTSYLNPSNSLLLQPDPPPDTKYFTLKMQAAISTETMAPLRNIKRRHNPENLHLYIYKRNCFKQLKLRNELRIWKLKKPI